MFGYNNKNRPPCYKCENREAGCHSTCKLYIEWKKYTSVKYEEGRLDKRRDVAFMNYKVERITKKKKG